jgi:hypothetical protein
MEIKGLKDEGNLHFYGRPIADSSSDSDEGCE